MPAATQQQQPSQLAQFKDFLGYLATVKGDLSNITAPPFLLSPRSVTEIPATLAERHALFLAPAAEPDPARRALLVLENFLCSLKRQVFAPLDDDPDGDGDGGGAKKPLNAFLGELFLGTFADPDHDGDDRDADGDGGQDSGSSHTQLIAEQVSHHPPVTACHIYNRRALLSSSGYIAQETTFGATSGVTIRQVGHAILRDEGHGESHLLTLPTMVVKGLVTGRPYPDLAGTCYISSSSGYLSTVRFEGGKSGGLWSRGGGGGKNAVHATLVNLRDGDRVLYEVNGSWAGELTVRDASAGAVVHTLRVDAVARAPLRMPPPDRQSPWESRRAWAAVRAGVAAGDFGRVARAKERLEEGQRALREAEQQTEGGAGGGADGDGWPRLFFYRAEKDDEFAVLARGIPDRARPALDLARTAGVWKFVGVDAAERLLQDPASWHPGLEPAGNVTFEGRGADGDESKGSRG